MSGILIDPSVKTPALIEQGDTVSWIDSPFTDSDGNQYGSTTYTLTYYIAGSAALLAVAGVAQGEGWLTSLTAAQTAALQVGRSWWQAKLSGGGQVITVARGELKVAQSLATVAAGYSGLSAAETALAQWKAALNALSGTSGPPVEMYKIGTREMKYRNIPEILATIARLETEVINERTADSIAQGQGNPRKLYARFRSRVGIQ